MSKKVRKANRKAKSLAQTREQYMEIAKRWLSELEEIEGMDYLSAHFIAFNLLDSLERHLLSIGYQPSQIPNYRASKLGGEIRADRTNFTPCNRCVCCEAMEDGRHLCMSVWMGTDKGNVERMECSPGDGCARGIPRKEYR